jgi:hypothetical protein
MFYNTQAIPSYTKLYQAIPSYTKLSIFYKIRLFFDKTLVLPYILGVMPSIFMRQSYLGIGLRGYFLYAVIISEHKLNIFN